MGRVFESESAVAICFPPVFQDRVVRLASPTRVRSLLNPISGEHFTLGFDEGNLLQLNSFFDYPRQPILGVSLAMELSKEGNSRS
jgi:hypothetical protein